FGIALEGCFVDMRGRLRWQCHGASEKVPTLRFGKKGIGEMLPAVAVRPQDMECFATRRRVDDARRQVRGLVEAEPLERHVDHPRWTLPTDSRIPDHLQIAESSVQLPGLPLPIP